MKHVEAFTHKRVALRTNYDWCGKKADGTGVITVWNQVDAGKGDSEVVFDKATKRCWLSIRVQDGERDWSSDPRAQPYLAICDDALASGRLVEVLLRNGDRSIDKARETYEDLRLYAVRVTYVGQGVTGDRGTVRGEFLSKAEVDVR